MSPLLFSLFIGDLEEFLKDSTEGGFNLHNLNLALLLFADDMVIIGNSPADLQHRLNRLVEYCTEWGLKINASKSKVIVFRKRGGIKQNEHWNVGLDLLEIVEQFNYLGTVFSSNGKFVYNEEYIAGRAQKSLNFFLKNASKLQLTVKTLCQLFDSFVGSILNYACAVWRFSKCVTLERIHLIFCKTTLHVKTSTNSLAVYGELGRFPLYVNRYCYIIKYWSALLQSPNVIVQRIYNDMLVSCNNGV